MSKLSDRVRSNSEAAPWVVEAIKKMEAEVERLKNPEFKKERPPIEQWKVQATDPYLRRSRTRPAITLKMIEGLFDWIKETEAEIGRLQEWQRQMVEKAAEKSLDGYRELGEKCAALEAERDRWHCLWKDMHGERQELRGVLGVPIPVGEGTVIQEFGPQYPLLESAKRIVEGRDEALAKAKALEAERERLGKSAQEYYNEASEGWSKFREAERKIEALRTKAELFASWCDDGCSCEHNKDDGIPGPCIPCQARAFLERNEDEIAT